MEEQQGGPLFGADASGTVPRQKMGIVTFISLTFLTGTVIAAVVIFILINIGYLKQLTNGILGSVDLALVEEEPVPDLPFEPKGALFINAHGESQEYKDMYMYTVEDEVLEKVALDLLWADDSKDGTITIGSKLFLEDQKVVSGLFSFTKAGEELVYASSSVGEVLLANPKISPSGKFYTFALAPDLSKITTYGQKFVPSEWRVYLGEIGSTQEPRLVVRGPRASFSPDETKLLYLGDDGFHIYDIATGKDVLVSELASEEKLTYVMADVSADGTKLVMTSSPTKEVKVADIISWEPFKLQWQDTVPMLAYWPAISPDNNYAAVMQFDWVDGHPGNRRVTILDLRTGKRELVSTLDELSKSDLIIADWVYINQ